MAIPVSDVYAPPQLHPQRCLMATIGGGFAGVTTAQE
jgi:hypothetical protein